MNLSWFLFYGRKIGMSKREILATPYEEMLDMLACLAIDNGASQKKEKFKPKQFDQLFSVR